MQFKPRKWKRNSM